MALENRYPESSALPIRSISYPGMSEYFPNLQESQYKVDLQSEAISA